jgi:hypothetical protein
MDQMSDALWLTTAATKSRSDQPLYWRDNQSIGADAHASGAHRGRRFRRRGAKEEPDGSTSIENIERGDVKCNAIALRLQHEPMGARR